MRSRFVGLRLLFLNAIFRNKNVKVESTLTSSFVIRVCIEANIKLPKNLVNYLTVLA